uniref:helix-turn-helix domain-containing protein n=1 Tax=Polaribacter sp. TaxID=1920175 RepID=UPI0040483A75
MLKNPELELALKFIDKTDRNLFITGKAGTGKTTFLHQIKQDSLKRMVVVAPTGVAAINAKGVTIHSFFQLPFGPILPNQIGNTSNQQRKFSKAKIDIIRSLDLVIIDEISMVRADLLDGIDQVMRRYKNRKKVFGGAQVLMIGDLQQLAPVIQPHEWSLLQQYYSSIYFFSSKAYQEAQVLAIELKHIYRQKNERFIHILNEIRNDTLSLGSEKILNERYDPNFSPSKEEGYITLTTHNNRANLINSSELNKLAGKSYFFKASVSGKFNENSFPNEETLELKIGAQVMFIKNDSSAEKRYFNGKIGVITEISKESVTVQCVHEIDEIVTEKETWENIAYTINEETKEIKEDITGSFSQIPLRLAWAITIHKSQGLTFEKAIIDAEASFAHGQTYVALSRCTSLEGIVLKTKISSKAIINDDKVGSFNKKIEENNPDDQTLIESEKVFQLNLISELFDFQHFLNPITRLIDVYYKNRTSIKGEVIEHLEIIKNEGVVPLLKIATSFRQQLESISKNESNIEESASIQERFTKAVDYFLSMTIKNIVQPLSKISFSSDNKAVKKDFDKQYDQLQEILSEKIFALKNSTDGFKTKTYLQTRAAAVLQKTAPNKKKKLTSKRDPVLALNLRELRDSIAKSENIPHFQIFTQETLYTLCDSLPKNEKDLLKVKGMGKIRVQKYGEEILACIKEYLDTQPLGEDIKPTKIPSKQISLALFKEGHDIKEIAQIRELTAQTIESHLMSFIPSGEIDILELMPLKKHQKLLKIIENTSYNSLSELKEIVGDSYSYTDLKMLLYSLER